MCDFILFKYLYDRRWRRSDPLSTKPLLCISLCAERWFCCCCFVFVHRYIFQWIAGVRCNFEQFLNVSCCQIVSTSIHAVRLRLIIRNDHFFNCFILQIFLPFFFWLLRIFRLIPFFFFFSYSHRSQNAKQKRERSDLIEREYHWAGVIVISIQC